MAVETARREPTARRDRERLTMDILWLGRVNVSLLRLEQLQLYRALR
jgi:hypothetical protein